MAARPYNFSAGPAALPEPVRIAAQTCCTPKQLEALQLSAAGYGAKRAGRILGITPGAYRSRLDGAMLKLRDKLGAVDA